MVHVPTALAARSINSQASIGEENMTNLQRLRTARGISQAQMAKTLGITRVELSKLENRWYSKAPKRIQSELHKLFGADWTFEALMMEAPVPTAPPLPGKRQRSRSKSPQGEKRVAA